MRIFTHAPRSGERWPVTDINGSFLTAVWQGMKLSKVACIDVTLPDGDDFETLLQSLKVRVGLGPGSGLGIGWNGAEKKRTCPWTWMPVLLTCEPGLRTLIMTPPPEPVP